MSDTGLIKRTRKIGLVKATNWSEETEPTTDNGLWVTDFSPPKGNRNVQVKDNEYGRGMASAGEVFEYEAQTGSMTIPLDYEGSEPILASLFGRYAHSEPVAGISKHKCIWSDVIDSIFHTLAWDEGEEIKALRTMVFTGGTFSYNNGLQLQLNYLGDKVIIPGWTGPLSVTYQSTGEGAFKLLSSTFQINNLEDPDFTDNDKVHPSGFETAIERGFEGLPVTAGNDCIDQPIEKTPPGISITLNFPKKETTTAAYFNAFNNRAYKKMRVKFTGILIGVGPYYFEFEMNFPKLMIIEAPEFSQDTPIPTTVKLKALAAETLPTGMEETVPYAFLQNEIPALTGYPA